MRWPIARAEIPGLCERVRAALEDGEDNVVLCDVEGVPVPDAVAIDALARLKLTARRQGGEIFLLHPNSGLTELLALVGLGTVVPVLALEPRRESEQGEQPGGVEEEREPGDPTV